MKRVYFLLGSNLGDRTSNMTKARQMLENFIGLIVTKSDIYVTKAWGKITEPDYLNQAVVCETNLKAEQILSIINQIEQNLKRKRIEKWGSRTIDIDIIFYENEIIDTSNLIIPHPLMQFRNFVLTPLNEIMPDFVHPILKKSIKKLLSECEDNLAVFKLN